MDATARWKKATTKVKLVNAVSRAFASCPHGIDGDTFFTVIPDEVREAVPLMYSMTEGGCSELVDLALTALKNGAAPKDSEFEAVFSANDGGASTYHGAVFTGLYIIIETALRNRCKASVVDKDLKQMNVPPSVVDFIVRKLKADRPALEDRSLTNRTRFPRLDSLHWRVDVAISSSSLLRVFRPSIVMQMALSDGRLRTFDVAIEQFHQLRYNVAKVLRNMQELERHPIMRIAFEADKKVLDD